MFIFSLCSVSFYINNVIITKQMEVISKDLSFEIVSTKFDHIKIIENADGAIIVIPTLINSEILITKSVFIACGSVTSSTGGVFSTCSSNIVNSTCFFSCYSKEYQNFYLNGVVTLNDVSCLQREHYFSASSVYGMISKASHIKNSNFSENLSGMAGFKLISDTSVQNSIIFTSFINMKSNDENSFFIFYANLALDLTNFINCSSKNGPQFVLLSSEIRFCSCVIINSPKIALGGIFYDCYLDSSPEKNVTYQSCYFLSNYPTILYQINGCFSYESNCYIETSSVPQNRISENGSVSCYEVNFCLFYGLNSSSNGGSIYLQASLISLSIFSSSFINCSTCSSLRKSMGGAIYFSSNDGIFIMKNSCGNKCLSDTAHFSFISVEMITINLTTVCQCSPKKLKNVGASLSISQGFIIINSSNNYPSSFESILSTGYVIIKNSAFVNNGAALGYIIKTDTINIQNSNICYNNADFGIFSSNSASIHNSLIMGNTAISIFDVTFGSIINSFIDFVILNDKIVRINTTLITIFDPWITIDNQVLCQMTTLPRPTPQERDQTNYSTPAFIILVVVILSLCAFLFNVKIQQRRLENTALIQQSIITDFG